MPVPNVYKRDVVEFYQKYGPEITMYIYGKSRASVTQYRKDLGLVKPRYDTTIVDQIRSYYKEGKNVPWISRKMDIPTQAIRLVIKKLKDAK